MRAKNFDKNFDAGVSLIKAPHIAQAKRHLQNQRRANVDFPSWIRRFHKLPY
jgi:hypothetical protein